MERCLRSAMGRAVRAGAVALVLVTGSGCMSWNPAPPLPRNGASIRVSFQPSRDVVARTRDGDSVRAAGMAELLGSVTRAVPETLYVRVTGTRQVRGSIGRVPRN